MLLNDDTKYVTRRYKPISLSVSPVSSAGALLGTESLFGLLGGMTDVPRDVPGQGWSSLMELACSLIVSCCRSSVGELELERSLICRATSLRRAALKSSSFT